MPRAGDIVPAAVCLCGTLAAGLLPRPAPASVPPETGDGWRVSAPEEQGLALAALEAMARRVETDPVFVHAYALLVARHGTLIHERYFNGRSREQRADVRSVTKSVLSMALGIAREEGRLPRSLDTRIAEVLPERYADLLDGEKAEITLADVLTMQAGLRWDDAAAPWLDQIFEAPDLVEYTLSEPLVATPGTVFEYSTGLSQVLAKVLISATGQSLASYVRDRLLSPLGIVDTSWLLRPSTGGTPPDHYGGLGLEIRPRDMAKLGQLALQDGNWRGRRLVPADWIRDSTRRQTAGADNYGYHWWGLPSGDQFVAIGYGGQYVFVDRPLDLVVVLQVDYYVPADRQVGYSSFSGLLDELRRGLLAAEAGVIAPAAPLPIEVGEGAGELRAAIERSGAADGAVEIAYRTVARSARGGRDYVASSGSVVWSSRETGPREIVVRLVDDDREEMPETFELELERLTGGDRLEARSLEIIVRDDDAGSVDEEPQRVSFGESTQVGREGEPAVLAIRRSSGTGSLDVAWQAEALLGGPEDLATFGGTATFADGALVADLVLEPVADADAEPPELFRVELSLPAGNGAAVIEEGGGSAVLAVLDATEPASCAESEALGDALCLHQGRFRVRAAWGSHGSTEEVAGGRGGALPLSTESGWFWFFDPATLELLVKILDAGSINQSYWVYFGTLSDLELFVIVEDLAGGAARLYRRAPGSLCGGADVEAFPSSSVVRPTDGARAAGASGGPPLLLDRFAVEVEWIDPRTGGLEPAVSSALTGGTALTWFLGPGNFELATKIVDGRAINGHHWLFAGALTDVEYTITVTDTSTGAVGWYQGGEPFCGIADVEAF
jgi:CubicO group peptidase (beta-lactamase class C family)